MPNVEVDLQPEPLVTTWAWLGEDGEPGPETRIAIDLEEVDGGTRVVMRHRGFESEEDRDRHRGGWASTLTRLEDGVA